MASKHLTTFLIGAMLLLNACAAGSAPPTPSAAPPSPAARLAAVPPTATRLPLPSPTPTRTPFPPAAVAPVVTPTPAALLVEVIAAALNVRRGPGLEYAVISGARAGDLFEVQGVDAAGSWLNIALPDGESGWISGQPSYTRLLGGDLAGVAIVTAAAPPAAGAATGRPVPVRPEGAGTLVFMTGSGGELFAIEADGSNLRRLAGGVIDPVVSPDGQRVAFTRWDGAEFGALFTINLDGSGERAIVGDIRQPKSPAWSPDGGQLIISFQHGGLRDPQRECRTFRPGNEPRLPERIEILWISGVRPDGSVRVCFVRLEDLQWRLRRVELATGDFEDLPSDEYAFNPAWDPQQPWRVIYDGNQGLNQLDLTSGQQWPLTTDVRDSGPVFSPDGRRLALTYKQHDHWEVYTLDLASGERRRLTQPPILAQPQYNSAAPAWSPDGRRLAFVTDRSGRWEIWVMNADGTEPRPLFAPETQARLGLTYRGVNERMLSWIK